MSHRPDIMLIGMGLAAAAVTGCSAGDLPNPLAFHKGFENSACKDRKTPRNTRGVLV